MKFIVNQKNKTKIFVMCIAGWLIRACYIYLTKEILYSLSYGPSHPHYDISYNLIKDFITSIIFLLESVVLFSLKKSEFCDNLLNMLYLIYLIPLNAVSSLVDANISFIILSNLFIFELIFCLSFDYRSRKRIVFSTIYKNDYYSENRIRSLCVVVCFLFIAFKLSINGLQFSLIFLGSETYANRMLTVELLRKYDGSIIGIISNILNDIATYVAPVYLFISIKERRWMEIIIAIITILAQFSLFSMKGTLLFIPIVLFLALYKNVQRFTTLLFGGTIVGFVALVVLWAFFGKATFYFVIVRRLLYIPTWLNTLYYDFFSHNPKLMLSDEVFVVKHFLPKVYDASILSVLNVKYFDGLVVSPNNGLFSEGYMQFGIIGLFFYPMLYKVIIVWFEKTYNKFSKQFNLLICSIIALNLPNVGMFRSDFVMSFFLMTIIIQITQKIRFKMIDRRIW